MKRILLGLALSTLTALPAAAQGGVEIGMLDCVVEGGVGFILGSSKEVSCTYHPAGGGAPESYVGVVRKFGLDIGATGAAYIKWGVLAPSNDVYSPGALAGNYVGVSAEATAGVGLGANALVGGSGRTFTLQPLSVQAQEGLNVAAGLSEFELHSAN
jgi:hypothetical protein